MHMYILEGKKAVPCSDYDEWAAWMETADRVVAKTTLPNEVKVSTVFLALDHIGGFFETMVFGGLHDQHCVQNDTWEDAEMSHVQTVLALMGE